MEPPDEPNVVIEYALPELGENIETGDVVNVLVSEGETIAVDQPVIEIETDKATIEVPSPAAGVVVSVEVAAGETIAVGQLLLTIESDAAARDIGGPSEPAIEVTSPPVHSVSEVAPNVLDPSAQAPPPAVAATAVKRESDVGARRHGSTAPARPSTGDGAAVDGGLPRRHVLAAPSVRRLAREFGVGLEDISGSGSRGRVTADDVKAQARRLLAQVRSTTEAPSGLVPELPDFTRWGAVERSRMTGVRRATARQMSRAWQTVPHVTQHDRADVSEFEAVRKRLKTQRSELPLTVTAYVVQVLARALVQFPQFNATLDIAREEVIHKKYINVGVAVDTDRGLLVPVVRDVDTKSLPQISLEIAALAEKARSRKVALEELQGGTFTVTNLGGLGGTLFTPIINYPEVAILGLSRATFEPVLVGGPGGSFQPRLMMPLSLSYDHRLIDGADAVRFLRWVAERIEHPLLLDLDTPDSHGR